MICSVYRSPPPTRSCASSFVRTKAFASTVGTGTELSPHLSAAFTGLQIDVDTVSAGNATPALTLTADVAVGSQLGTRRDAGLPPLLETTRSALTVANPAVQVFDTRYAGVSARI